MNKKKITYFTDTDCNITPKIAAKYGFKLISMPYRIGHLEIAPYVDFEEFDYHDFYNLLRRGVIPTTAALSPEEYIQYIEPEFAKGNDIVYFHFSASMSSTFNSLRLALELLSEKYPNRSLELVDTKNITFGSQYIIERVGDFILQGLTFDEIRPQLDEIINSAATYFYADNLKFFGKSGRVSGFSAFMGGMIGIKPIIFVDNDGVMKTKEKGIGRKATLDKLLQKVVELEDHIQDYPVIVAHTDCIHLAHKFALMLEEKFGKLNIKYEVVNPTIGAHSGPDCVGLTFHAKHR